eukprot:2219446-Amphidinium_carterae.1
MSGLQRQRDSFSRQGNGPPTDDSHNSNISMHHSSRRLSSVLNAWGCDMTCAKVATHVESSLFVLFLAAAPLKARQIKSTHAPGLFARPDMIVQEVLLTHGGLNHKDLWHEYAVSLWSTGKAQ